MTEPTSPQATPLLGHLPLLSKGKYGCFYDAISQAAKAHSPICQLKIAGQRWYLVSDAPVSKELLGARRNNYPKGKTLNELKAFGLGANGVTFSEGHQWAEQRKMFQPIFSPAQLPRFAETIQKHTEVLCERIEKMRVVKIGDVMTKFSMASLCNLLFSYETDTLDRLDQKDPLIERQRYATEQLIIRIKRTPLWRRLPIPSNFRVKTIVREQKKFLSELIDARRANPDAQDDLLKSLLSSRREDGSSLSTEEIQDQLQTFLGAGFESTASVLHWLFYYLAVNPETQKKLHAEVTQFFAEGLPADEIPFLEYLHFVLKETMRLRPPFPFLGREVKADDEVLGMKLKGGSLIFFMLADMQTDSKIWGQDSQAFRPERFAKDQITSEQTTSYNPFGLGNRFCLGNHFATQQMAIVVAVMVSKFLIDCKPGQDVTPVYQFSWNSVNDIELNFIPRERA